MKRIAIIGTGQVAQSIIPNLKKSFLLDVYVNKQFKLKDKNLKTYKLKNFPQDKNIVAVINAGGPGDPNVHKKSKNIFNLFNYIDEKILKFIIKNQKIKYINISSGVVLNLSKLNKNKDKYDYVDTKYYIEQKHRSYKNHKIYDLRVFGYFSRFINLKAGFFLSKVLKSLKEKAVLNVDPHNNVRDFIGGYDLSRFIKIIINGNFTNRSFNLLSKKKSKKFEILKFLKKDYRLKFNIDKNSILNAKRKKIQLINKKFVKSALFKPKYSSMSLIKKEIKFLQKTFKNGKK